MIECVYSQVEPITNIRAISEIIRIQYYIGKLLSLTFLSILKIPDLINIFQLFGYFVTPKRIPDIVREDITNEWMPFSARTVDCFGKIAMQQFSGITMYPISYYENVENFQPHKSSEIDDIQILAGIFGGNRRAHAMCIYYQASNKFVLIYDSMDPMIYKNSLDPIQKIILDKLYPFKKDIIFIKPKSYQDKSPSCAIFAIMYATMLFLKLDPANTEIKLNCVHGDETLFMRLHILKMFAERKLSLMDDGMKKDCSLVTVPLAMKKFKPHTGIHCLMRTQKARC